MQEIAALEEAQIRIVDTISIIENIMGELEGFDKLIEHPIWGKLQSNLILLKSDYQDATTLISGAKLLDESDDPIDSGNYFDEIMESVEARLKPQLSDLLLGGASSVTISVQVNPSNISNTTIH